MDFNSFSIEELNDKGKEASTISPSSLYEASKETGLSLGALRNARDIGNTLLTRRRNLEFIGELLTMLAFKLEKRKEERKKEKKI